MRKLKLQADDLVVESFPTHDGGILRGTVAGNDSAPATEHLETCYVFPTCNGLETCPVPQCDPAKLPVDDIRKPGTYEVYEEGKPLAP